MSLRAALRSSAHWSGRVAAWPELPAPVEIERARQDVEAQAAGLPCVVVGALGAAEGVTSGVTGLVTGPNLNEFRSAVARLLQDFDLRTAMKIAAADSAKYSSIVIHGERLEAVYRLVVE